MTSLENPKRPLMTLSVIAYQQEAFIREAVEGAFAQTYEPLEIILSDDCSPDGTFAVMEAMAIAYEGPHKIVLRRNEKNLGLAGHVNEIVALAKGRYLGLAAGDDISEPSRMDQAWQAFAKSGASFVESGYVEIDIDGVSTGRINRHAEEDISLAQFLARKEKRNVGAARTYDLACLRRYPPLRADCPTEDTTFLLRCLMCGPGRTVPMLAIKRRLHGNNLSTGENASRLPYDNLRDQYLSDIAFANDNGMVGDSSADRLVDWARGWHLYRSSVQALQRGRPAISVIARLAFARAPLAYKLRVIRYAARLENWKV